MLLSNFVYFVHHISRSCNWKRSVVLIVMSPTYNSACCNCTDIFTLDRDEGLGNSRSDGEETVGFSEEEEP